MSCSLGGRAGQAAEALKQLTPFQVEQLEQEKTAMVSQEDLVEITKENEELKEVLSAVQLDLERETTVWLIY